MAADDPLKLPASEEPPESDVPQETAVDAGGDIEEIGEVESGPWQPPPAQPLRILSALTLIGGGGALYGLVLTSFWSSHELGIHQRFPYPAYGLIALSLLLALAGLGLSLGIWSPHAKLGIGLFGFFACIAIGVGGGRFVSYTLRGTLNPSFTLHLGRGDRFPDFALKDQNGATHTLRDEPASATLIVIYRGDFCPFARFELADLTAHQSEFRRDGIGVVAISADPGERSIKLSSFLRTSIPLLSDQQETLLGPLGLVQHHRNGEPDNAIPAYFVIDRNGVVRWISTSPYYRELPRTDALLAAGAAVAAPAASAVP